MLRHPLLHKLKVCMVIHRNKIYIVCLHTCILVVLTSKAPPCMQRVQYQCIACSSVNCVCKLCEVCVHDVHTVW